jgi:hypothetical protein
LLLQGQARFFHYHQNNDILTETKQHDSKASQHAQQHALQLFIQQFMFILTPYKHKPLTLFLDYIMFIKKA